KVLIGAGLGQHADAFFVRAITTAFIGQTCDADLLARLLAELTAGVFAADASAKDGDGCTPESPLSEGICHRGGLRNRGLPGRANGSERRLSPLSRFAVGCQFPGRQITGCKGVVG